MKPDIYNWAPEVASKGLCRLGPWDWLITSGRGEGEGDETRATWCRDQFPEIPILWMHRTNPATPHQFCVKTINWSNDDVDWSQLADCLGKEIRSGQGVLIDMSLLSFDALLYLLPALRERKIARLACVYITPDEYTFPEQALSDQLLHPVEQPKAYVALALDADRQRARHLVFLGFDQGRAWKFINKYDWKFDHLHIALGDPPFVENGREKAEKAAETWLEPFQRSYPGHVTGIDATDPSAVADWCLTHWKGSEWLDIVPLGPKPMNLGILWFYFGITKEERGRVRLLYDFPVQRAPRSQGVKQVYLFDCARMLT